MRLSHFGGEIPREVRQWWTTALRSQTDFRVLCDQARTHWPERDAGADGVAVMYGIVNAPVLEVVA